MVVRSRLPPSDLPAKLVGRGEESISNIELFNRLGGAPRPRWRHGWWAPAFRSPTVTPPKWPRRTELWEPNWVRLYQRWPQRQGCANRVCCHFQPGSRPRPLAARLTVWSLPRDIRLFEHRELVAFEDLLGQFVVFHAQRQHRFSLWLRNE